MSTTNKSAVEDLEIQARVTGPHVRASVPTLDIKLEFTNRTDRKIWVLPFVCEISLAQTIGPGGRTQPIELYLGNTMAYQEGSSASRFRDVYVHMGDKTKIDLDARLELGFQKVNMIESIRRYVRSVHLNMRIYGWIQTQEGEPKTIATSIENITVAESDWVNWLNTWGKETRLILLAESALARFEDLKKSWKVDDDSELVALMVEKLHEAPLEQKTEFVCTLPQLRSIQDKVKDVLKRAGDVPEVLATGWVDQIVVPDLLELAKRRVALRLILPAGETKQPSRDVKDALRQLSSGGIEIRKNDMLHGRIVVSGDREAIIASSDLKTDSLIQNREAGIYTTDPTTIRHATDFFNKIWEESTQLSDEK